MALVPVNDLTRVRDGMKRFSSGFTTGQKVVTAVAVVAAVVGAFVFMSIAGRPTYVPLFTNLAPSDASSITQLLTSAHVPYQLEDGGTTILVPQNDVNQERLAAAQAGLPAQSTAGLSILDKEGLTTSQLAQQADYLRALQGELEQTIDAIEGVTSSQVNVALAADQTLALGNNNPTGASVLVSLQPGHVLTSDQVSAIVHLVSSSVPGLDSSQVTVADSNGDLLAGPGVQNDAGGGSEAAAYDAAQQEKILAYLTSVLGADNADVQVNATLDFDQVKTNTQQIMTGPNGQPISFCNSTSQQSTTANGNGTQAAGAAGALGTTTGGSNGTYTQTQNSNSCEASQQSQSVTKAPGSVTQQSVAVLLNSKAMPKGISMAELQKGIAAAADIQTARGDVLSVNAMPFKPPGAAPAATKTSIMTTALKPGVALLVVLLILFLLWRNSKKARRQPVSTDEMISTLALEQLAASPPDEVASPRPAVTAGQDNSIYDVIDDQPDEVASVLRDWLNRNGSAQPAGARQ